MADDLSVYDPETGMPYATSYAAPTPKLIVNGISVDAPTLNPVGNGYNNPYYTATTNTGEHAADVYASANQGIRLLAKDGSVIFEGTGADAARDATALANYISQTDGKKAAWELQVENPDAPGEYQRAGYDTADKKKGGGILGALLDIALPILANIVLPGSGFLASAVASAAGSGVSSAIQGRSLGNSLLAAGLSGVGGGIGSQLGAGASAAGKGALSGLTTTPGSITQGLSSAISQLPSTSLAAIPAGLTGTGSLISALSAVPGGLTSAAANELSPLIVQASNLAKSGMDLSGLVSAGIPQAVASAVMGDIASGVDPEAEVVRYLPEDTLDPLTVEVPGQGGNPLGAGVGSAVGSGAGAAADPNATDLSPVEVTPSSGWGNELDGLDIWGSSLAALPDYSHLTPSNGPATLPSDLSVRTPSQYSWDEPTDLDPLVVSPSNPLEGLTTIPGVVTPPVTVAGGDPPTIPPLIPPVVPAIGGGGGGPGINPLDLLPLLGGAAGAGGGGSGGGTGVYTPVPKPGIFSATSPKFELQPRTPRGIDMSREEWLKYGSQPEVSFFSNVPIQHSGIADGGDYSPYLKPEDNALATYQGAGPSTPAPAPTPLAQSIPPPPVAPANMSVRNGLAVTPSNSSGLSPIMEALRVNPLALRGQASTLTAKDIGAGLSADQIAIEKAKNPYWPYPNMTDSSLGRNSVLWNTVNPTNGPTWQQTNFANSADNSAWMNYNPDGSLGYDPQFGHINKSLVGDPGWSSLPQQVSANDLAVQKAKYDEAQAAQKASDEIDVRKALAGQGRSDYVGYDKALGYAQGGLAVRGHGSGRDDSIPARLSDGEYVIDAETVALLGDGSSKSGADRLDQFRVDVRRHKGQQLAKGRFSDKAKPAMAYMAGGHG